MSAPKIILPEQELSSICYGTFKGSTICACDECTNQAEYQITIAPRAEHVSGCFFTVVVCKIHIACFLKSSGGKTP